MTELPRHFWLCNCLWPLASDVTKRHLRWGQLITQFHRWIHGCSNQTWDALMLERPYNIDGHAHMVKTEETQTGDVRGWQAREDQNTVISSTVRRVKVSGLCYQWIHLQQITLGCNVFFSNSHQRLVTSLRGSAQILQQTVQCSSGLYKPECATVRQLLKCKLSSVSASVHVHHRKAHCPLLHIWDFMRMIRKRERNNHVISFYIQPHDTLCLKIALILCVVYYENWFSSHVKCSSSLRSSPWPISIIPLMLCASTLCKWVRIPLKK